MLSGLTRQPWANIRLLVSPTWLLAFSKASFSLPGEDARGLEHGSGECHWRWNPKMTERNNDEFLFWNVDSDHQWTWPYMNHVQMMWLFSHSSAYWQHPQLVMYRKFAWPDIQCGIVDQMAKIKTSSMTHFRFFSYRSMFLSIVHHTSIHLHNPRRDRPAHLKYMRGL